MVEFEEIEDEGACYAFAISASRLLFIVGQEFYETDEFPNDDFSIVEVLDPHGVVLDDWLVSHGRKLIPRRTIAATVKKGLVIPDHLDLIEGTVTEVEHALGRSDR